MMMDGVFAGISSQAIIRAKSSNVLLVTLLVSYTAGRGWTRESSGNVGRSSQDREGCKLLMTVPVTLAVES